ncbi:MAG: J domain-containing protein, partial [Nanoarchaeota archaeon]|nr:J domain-containing protein [Nanoarchaeota archaeon]
VFGCEKKINLNKNINCEDCLGTGAENQELKRCDECGGAGEKVVSRKTPFGIFNQVMICKVCEGTGEVPKKKCKSCNGQGVIKKTKTITVKIPKGINNGQILRVSGKGESIKNGESGDLLVVMNVKPHEFFKREGDDIYSTLPISFSQAVLGGEIIVQTLYGETKIKISPGIESGKVLRLKGKGVENVEGWRVGDYFIQIKIQTPKKINKKQKELFIELAKLEKDNSKSEKKFFKKFLNR